MFCTLINLTRGIRLLVIALALLICSPPIQARTSLGNEIAYSRSNMRLNGDLLNGTFDFQFKLFDEQNAGNLVAPAITRNDIPVNNGVLKAQVLDFGDGAFNGEARFIDVKARQGNSAFQAVGPRQAFRPVPYALALPGLYTQPNAECPNIIGGFAGNIVAGGIIGATISGGGEQDAENAVTGTFGTIGGGFDNFVPAIAAVVAGGRINTASGDAAAVSGGTNNVASGAHSAIGGGVNNLASDADSVVTGGTSNEANGAGSVVSGGSNNTASGDRAAVAGGVNNVASGFGSMIAGGSNNAASGDRCTVVGGSNNLAAGNFSLAAGRRANADANGTFVWADSTDTDFSSGGTNTFNVRSIGGAVFYSSSNLSTGVVLLAGGGSWDSFCDRNAKENFKEIDALDILQRVVAMPLTTWNYKAQSEDVRHIGPMAQDFHAAFRMGESDKRIATIDADGVLFAAVQGLHQMLIERDAHIVAQGAQIDELNQRLARLEQVIQPH